MYALRYGVGAVALLIAISFAFINRGVRGDEYREKMIRLVAQVPGYDQSPGYYDGLVDSCHEQAFLDNYHMRAPSRRNRDDKSYLDEPQYVDDMFQAMIQAATTDGAPHVATALTKYYETAINPPPPPEPKQLRQNRTRR